MKTIIKKSILFASALLATVGVASCGESTEKKPPVDGRTQLILDNKFQNGFTFHAANGTDFITGSIPDNRWTRDVDLTYGNSEGTISWLGGQHGDIYGFNDVYNKTTNNEPTYENGYYTFKDTSKVLSVNPEIGALYLELNTSLEYSRPRRSGEQWCHLLLEQGFTEVVYVGEAESINLTVDIEMKKLVNHMTEEEFDRNLHTVQYLMYLVIKSEAALDANDFFWFGIPFYDYRYAETGGIVENGGVDSQGAGATGKFIYQFDAIDMLPNGLPLNEKQSINIDLKPYIESALVMAVTDFGKFTNSTINDLTFQSMNIGFEIPGTFDCGIEISNFALYVD